MRMRQYTTAIHVERLKEMLQKEFPCGHCPAANGFNPNLAPSTWALATNPCSICHEFVDIKSPLFFERCPCRYYGPEKALALTIQKSEEYDEARK
jgi:transcription elongation factor Elf1